MGEFVQTKGVKANDTVREDVKANGVFTVNQLEGQNGGEVGKFYTFLREVEEFRDRRQDSVDDESQTERKKCCQHGIGAWCRKYFWEGQELESRHQERLANISENMAWHERFLLYHRRWVALLIPALIFHVGWWAIMIQHNLWYRFADHFYISIMMIFGSLIAGMTSVGGGAVAFPVLTLAFQVSPHVARDFAMMIQSCGMSCASFSIFFMHVQIEKVSLILCLLGGSIGCIFGFHLVSPFITVPQKKMAFVSIFFAFGVVLTYLNRNYKRKTFLKIRDMNLWKCLVLFVTGFVGGIFTSFAGNGTDITYFSIVTLLFRISEKVATPTSVVLMAGNSLVGFFWRGTVLNDISPEAWHYLTVSAQIVVFGAPLGCILGTHFHRLLLASFVIILVSASLIGAYVSIRPLTPGLIGLSVAIIVGGVILFGLICLAGWKLLLYQESHKSDDEAQENQQAAGNGHHQAAADNEAYDNDPSATEI